MFNIKLGSHVRIFGCASGVYNWCFSGEAAGMAASLIQDAGFLQNAGHPLCIVCYTPGWWFQPTHLKNHGVRQLGLG